MGVTAAIVTAVAAVAGTTNSVVQSNKQNKASKKAVQKQETLLTQQTADAKRTQAESVTTADAEAKRKTQAAGLARNRAMGASGRSDTLLTGLGSSTAASAASGGKTLLGM